MAATDPHPAIHRERGAWRAVRVLALAVIFALLAIPFVRRMRATPGPAFA